MFFRLDKKKLRIEELGAQDKKNESFLNFDPKSIFFLYDYYSIIWERKIIKKYFLFIIYFLLFIKNALYNFYFLIFFYVYIYLFFDNKIINVFIIIILLFSFLKIVLILFKNFFYLIKLSFYLFKNYLNKIDLIFVLNFLLFFFIFLNILKIFIFEYFIFIELKKYYFKLKLYISINVIRLIYLIKIFLFLFYYLLNVYFFNLFIIFNSYDLIIFFKNNFIQLLKKFYKIYFNVKSNFILIKINNIFLKYFFKLKNIWRNWKFFIVKILIFLEFLFELLFFWKKTTVFKDRYTFFVWDDIRNPDYEYTTWDVNYIFIKYYADRNYFGWSGYFFWRIHILKYEVIIPLSYLIHKYEWKLELYEIKTFTLMEQTSIETFYLYLVKIFNFFIFDDNSFINRKNILLDIYDFIKYFLIEDLFLYYTQINLIIKYKWKYFWFYLEKFIILIKNYYDYFNFLIIKERQNYLLIINFRLILVIYILLNFIYIYLKSIFLKFIKILKKYNKVYKFLFFINLKLYFKILLYIYFFLLKIIKILLYISFNNNNLIKRLFFFNSNLKIKKIILKKKNNLTIDYIIFKKYENEQLYILYDHYFAMQAKNLISLYKNNKEQNDLYIYLKSILSTYTNLKSFDKLNWYDRLTGGYAGYFRIYKLYLNYNEKKNVKNKKKYFKFKSRKDIYFFKLKNK